MREPLTAPSMAQAPPTSAKSASTAARAMRGPRERRLAAGRLAIPARPALAPRGAPKLRGALACETVARERFDGDAARRAVVAPPARFAVAPAAAPPLCGVTAFEELFGLAAARAEGRDADEEGRAEEDCAVAEEDDRTVPFGRETRFEGMTMRRSARARARRLAARTLVGGPTRRHGRSNFPKRPPCGVSARRPGRAPPPRCSR